MLFKNLESSHKTKQLNIQLPLHSTRGLGGMEMSKSDKVICAKSPTQNPIPKPNS